MINLQAVMLRFAEPFLYGKYSKIDHIDTKYFPMVTRANIAEETRINATAEEVNVWKMRLNETGAIPKSFISDIFFLCAGYNHLGIVRTIITHGKITKHNGEIDKWLETAGLAETPSGHQHTPHQGLIERAKANQTRYQRELLACELQLQVPDITQRNLAFINYTMVWMLRMVDPTHQYPSKAMTLPLPERVPDEFNMLPEYFVEDTVEYYIYVMRHCPELLDNSLRIEFLVFALTFLTSTWYVKNPLLKSKLLQGLFYGSIHVGHEYDGLLIALFNSHPMALQHLIPSLMWFYVDKFARFAVLLTHDTTSLLDGLSTKITSIKKYQLLIANKEQRDALSVEERSKKEEDFRQDEEMASSYATLGMSTVELLRNFTMETKATFLTLEIVNHLAAMLVYNIDMLCGPRCSSLQIKNMERYRFRPRQLLGELFQIFLNLSEDTPFVQAVANEGKNYKKDVFLKAAAIVHQRAIKSEIEIEKFVAFIQRVEHSKILIERGNGLGDTAV
ncbi:unnamed protein product [Rhizoctonia solani]|uniref:Ubiquitin conjugation factor E4 core domain-containing protein n=1 Tax=Rhizoctonia solani TaxID=456999 RepID=A0A8H3HDB9_9AGAM|nr:unnamed protein product [Rhizoctonia solani]